MNQKPLNLGEYKNIFPFEEQARNYAWDINMEMKHEIEQRQYSQVLKGQDLHGNPVLVKKIKLDNLQNQQGLENELKAMKDLESKNIVKILDVYSITQSEQQYLYVFEEFCPQSLSEYLNNIKNPLTEEEAIQILTGIINGLKDFIQFESQKIQQIMELEEHPQLIVYESLLDLKPSNIFIDNLGNAKIASNFGLQSALYQYNKIPLVGAQIYKSPQVVMNEMGQTEMNYTDKADVWSLGMVFYELLFGKSAWPCREQHTYLQNIIKYGVQFPYQKQIGENTKDFILKCLSYEEGDRPSWFELFTHPIFSLSGKGKPVQRTNIILQPDGIHIMKEIQQIIYLRDVDMEDFCQKADINYDGQLSKKEFYYMINSLDPRITYFEAQAMFNQISYDLKQVNINDFYLLLKNYNFSDLNDKGSILLEDLKQIVKHRNIEVDQIFSSNAGSSSKQSTIKTQEMNVSRFLSQKSGLDKKGFQDLIGYLAPGLKPFEVDILYKTFDKNRNNYIEKEEIFEQFKYGFSNIQLINEKAKRLIYRKLFKQYLPENNTQIKQQQQHQKIVSDLLDLFRVYDKNEDGTLSFEEFMMLMHDINHNLPKNDIQAMFQYLDTNNSGSIDTKEFLARINQEQSMNMMHI